MKRSKANQIIQYTMDALRSTVPSPAFAYLDRSVERS